MNAGNMIVRYIEKSKANVTGGMYSNIYLSSLLLSLCNLLSVLVPAWPEMAKHGEQRSLSRSRWPFPLARLALLVRSLRTDHTSHSQPVDTHTSRPCSSA